MSSVIEFKHRKDDTLWAVVAQVGRASRVAEIFPSRERALADRAWREQQIRAYASLLASCRQPAPSYSVAPIRHRRTCRGPGSRCRRVGFLRGQFI